MSCSSHEQLAAISVEIDELLLALSTISSRAALQTQVSLPWQAWILVSGIVEMCLESDLPDDFEVLQGAGSKVKAPSLTPYLVLHFPWGGYITHYTKCFRMKLRMFAFCFFLIIIYLASPYATCTFHMYLCNMIYFSLPSHASFAIN